MTTWNKLADVRLWAAPFNGPDDPDASVNWVDITRPYLLMVGSGQPVSVASGRQSEWQNVNVGTFSATLNNADGRFTAGNTSSPYYPGWRTGMRLRQTETIGYKTFTTFDGNMLQPEAVVQLPNVDQTVVVNATDRLGRLQQSRQFISTLAEYVIYNGGSNLKAYYPLNESRPPLRDLLGGNQPMLVSYGASAAGSASTTPLVQLGQGSGPPGDDLRGPVFTPLLDANSLLTSYASLTANLTTPITQASGETITVAAWVAVNDVTRDLLIPFAIAGTNGMSLEVDRTGSPGFSWALDAVAGSGPPASASVFCPPPLAAASLIALRMTLPSGVVELWRDADTVVTATLSGGAVPSSASWNQIRAGQYINGTVTHVQVYVGNGAYPRSMHLAQVAAGHDGLSGQYTGQRITTIAQYAGMAAGDMDIDAGTSRMQRATLAGRTPLDVMQEAATTEQGLLHAAGRRLIFHDRLRRYNR